jgi:hypothetical protein
MKKRKRGRPRTPAKMQLRNGFSVRVRDEAWKALQRSARSDGRSISAQAGLFIEQALRRKLKASL